MCFKVMKPHIVVNRHVKEKNIKSLTLIGCRNNVRTFLTTMKEKYNEINSLPWARNNLQPTDST